MAPEVLRPGEMKTVISLRSPVVKTPLGTGGCFLLTRELSKHALCTSHGEPRTLGLRGCSSGQAKRSRGREREKDLNEQVRTSYPTHGLPRHPL